MEQKFTQKKKFPCNHLVFFWEKKKIVSKSHARPKQHFHAQPINAVGIKFMDVETAIGVLTTLAVKHVIYKCLILFLYLIEKVFKKKKYCLTQAMGQNFSDS